MDRVDAVVVGAGVVGLACARALAREGLEVLVVESEARIGTGISARNSEVIHAGLYYPATMLKTRLCVRGRSLLYAYLGDRGLPHRRCGKLVVATSEAQHDALERIRVQALANGVDDVVAIDAAEAVAMEPKLHCTAALLSPGSGIVDVHALMLAVQGDLEHAGGLVVLHSRFEGARPVGDGFDVAIAGAGPLRTRVLVNAAGLDAQCTAASIADLPASSVPPLRYARGQYFSIAGRAPFSRLVYPIPEPGGLGIHFTLDLGDGGKVGPDVQWVAAPDYQPDLSRVERFYDAVRRYLPSLPDGALAPAYVGVRPKLHGEGEPLADFRIDGAEVHGLAGLVNLFGIESPGVTASLAIAEEVAKRVGLRDAAGPDPPPRASTGKT